ncbi:MAG: hypothetical protein ABSC48_16425 [Terracidiphilus sp.]|jgi:hypothetical protein
MIASQPGKTKRLKRIAAWLLLLAIALGLRIGLAIHFPNVFHPDEVFQTLEPAHRLAYGYGVATWEWRAGVRSWVFPAFLAGVMRSTGWMGPGASGYTYGIIAVLSLASLSTVWFAFAWAKRASGMEAGIIAAGACSIFFGLVYFAPKTLTEVVATDFLLPGLYLGVYGEECSERKRLFLAGILLGLAASLRVQLLPAVAFAAVWFCWPGWRRRTPAVAAGFALPILAFGLVDWVTWSYPWQSIFRYFHEDILAGRNVEYGAQPWYWYLLVLVNLLGFVIVFLRKGAARSPLLGWVALIVLCTHSLFAHKEARYIYPVLPLAIVLASMGFVEAVEPMRIRRKLPEFSKGIVAAGLAFFLFSSAFTASRLLDWWEPVPAQAALDRLSRDPALCGVGYYGPDFYGVNWAKTGGYSRLHRNVPMILAPESASLAREAPAFNALIAPAATSPVPAGFSQSGCWNGMCLYQRAGACQPPQPEDTLEGFLLRTGN